jgi:hypothetical protein
MRLLPLWAIRPVQSLRACTRVHFTFLTVEYYIHVNKMILIYWAYHFTKNRIFCDCDCKKIIMVLYRVYITGVCIELITATIVM